MFLQFYSCPVKCFTFAACIGVQGEVSQIVADRHLIAMEMDRVSMSLQLQLLSLTQHSIRFHFLHSLLSLLSLLLPFPLQLIFNIPLSSISLSLYPTLPLRLPHSSLHLTLPSISFFPPSHSPSTLLFPPSKSSLHLNLPSISLSLYPTLPSISLSLHLTLPLLPTFLLPTLPSI